jgi:hypothetical protein
MNTNLFANGIPQRMIDDPTSYTALQAMFRMSLSDFSLSINKVRSAVSAASRVETQFVSDGQLKTTGLRRLLLSPLGLEMVSSETGLSIPRKLSYAIARDLADFCQEYSGYTMRVSEDRSADGFYHALWKNDGFITPEFYVTTTDHKPVVRIEPVENNRDFRNNMLILHKYHVMLNSLN